MSKFLSTSLCVALLTVSVAANASGQVVTNDLSKCKNGPSTLVHITGIKAGTGKLRVQSYRATNADWLAKGRWINRIEVPARAGSMTVCVPLPEEGSYGIAVRHDVNGNGKTDLRSDGGGMSNNPSISIFNLGKPSYKKTAFAVGNAPKTISITMKYM
ncbi:DUF2141 domain-containing protein [Sphingopyxis sp. YF1]|jgi:uncharacterized protein (DUF2141 family)|uniref:DUF2141 domain-containing protein n=1 Tax=Sphingopyxis sp. YF1 TaxID=2482763 RepID=UPI001F620B89|nr:DUF2141 domain-containing protein [Sphingopyxis sp. YF1]UNU42640.1 DUF2141 domain-containing protein [Sphingopyxis sp. YF1]